MQVIKFSAIASGDVARMRTVVSIVVEKAAEQVVVVCTALEGVTDQLIGAARAAVRGDEATVSAVRKDLWSRHRTLAERVVQDAWEREALYRDWANLLKTYDRITRAVATLGEVSPRATDAVAALGERFIALLFAVILREAGVPARLVDASQIIVTDSHFGAAEPLLNESLKRARTRLQELLRSKIVPVVPGYIGANVQGVVTTLGRGGGDYTAALIGAAMGASEVCLWTDVDGILTADPKTVRDARTISVLSYAQAAEIAMFGAEVLHPRTLAPLQGTGTTLRIRSILNPDREGTAIVPRLQQNGAPVRMLISARGLCRITVSSGPLGWKPEVPAATLAQLANAGLEVLSSAQSFGARSFSFTVRGIDATFARASVEHLIGGDLAAHVHIAAPMALVAVVGGPDTEPPTARVLTALGRSGVQAITVSTGEHGSLSLLLPDDQAEQVLQMLHSDLRLATFGR